MRLFYGIARLAAYEIRNFDKTKKCTELRFGFSTTHNVRSLCLETIRIHLQQCGVVRVTHRTGLLSTELFRLDIRSPFLESYSTEVTRSTTGQKNTEISPSVAENIKETTKTVSYTVMVLTGFGVIIAIVYAVFSELFSSKSAYSVYSRTFAYVISDERVRNVFGNSIKAFGEETHRGRRQHVSHVQYNKDGKNYLRMKFYIKGDNGESGSVHLEMVENDKGKYDYRYLFVNVDDIRPTHKVIILEDNRGKFEKQPVAFMDAALSETDFSFK